MSNPQSVAAANALSGERSFVQVQYPITGDPQLDLISGCLAVLNGGNGPTNLNTTGKICVLKYLLDRFTKNLEWEKEGEAQRLRLQALGQSYAADRVQVNPLPTCPPPYPYDITYGQPYSPQAASGTTKDPSMVELFCTDPETLSQIKSAMAEYHRLNPK